MLRQHRLLHAEDGQGHLQMTEHRGISCCQMKIAEDPDGTVRPMIRGDRERKQVSLSHCP